MNVCTSLPPPRYATLLVCLLATAATAAPVWQATQVGTLTAPFQADEPAEGRATLDVTGGLLWGEADGFGFLWTEPEGNFDLQVQLKEVDASSDAIAGLMIRAMKPDGTFSPGDPYRFEGVRFGDRMLQGLARQSRDAATVHQDMGKQALPLWLRATRHEGLLKLWRSTDGKSWTPAWGTPGEAVSFQGRVAVGLAASGRKPGSRGRAVYEDITLGPLQSAIRTSWLGNSLPGGGRMSGHVPNFVRAVWVDPSNGDLFINGEDESSGCKAFDADGRFRWTRTDPNFKHGSAIAADGTWVYQAYERARGENDGFVRIERETGRVNGQVYDRGHRITGLAVHEGLLFVADATSNRISFWDTATQSQVREAPFESPGPLAVDRETGLLWVIRTDSEGRGKIVVQLDAQGQPTGVVIDTLEWPRGVAVGPGGRIYVADSGRAQQVVIFDREGRRVGALGAEGGVWSRYAGTVPGESHPLKFNFPNAIAVDDAGNVTLVCSGPKQWWGVLETGSGTDIRKFDHEQRLLWKLLSSEYVDCGDFAPGTDGRVVYSRDARYDLDLDSGLPSGREWTHCAFTIDPFRFPDDPRLHVAKLGGTWVRTIAGKQFLFVTDMVSENVLIFRSEPDSMIWIPAGRFDRGADNRPYFHLWVDHDGDGRMQDEEIEKGAYQRHVWSWWVDARGDVWEAARVGPITRYRVQGIDDHGNPVYRLEARDEWPRPTDVFGEPNAPGTGDLERACYLPESDTLFLSGYTLAQPKPKEAREWGAVGTELLRYDHWTTAPELRYRIVLPYAPNTGGHVSAVVKSLAFAGDRVFAIRSSDARVFVYDLATGAAVTDFRPGPEVGGHSGLIDVMHGLNAMRRLNGEYLLLAEDDDNAKTILYRIPPSQ